MVSPAPGRSPWPSLWIVALFSLVGQLALCQFFSFGERVPLSLDLNPSNLWKVAYQFPPTGEFLTLNWLGLANLPPPLNPYTLGAHLPVWFFFTTYTPILSTLALLAMVVFLREFELSRPAALFGGLVYAWQGDILSFIFPGHYAYIAMWPFFALAAWAALRGLRMGNWIYALISGACCGTMVGLQPDRGAIASLLVAAFYLAPLLRRETAWLVNLRQFVLCVSVALLVSLAAFLALFQSYIVGVHLGGNTTRAQTYSFTTQFSLGPQETLTYLVPGFFGWHTHNEAGPYWGSIGQTPDWNKTHQGSDSLNLAISTTGTLATVLAFLGLWTLLPQGGGFLPPKLRIDRQQFFGRMLAALGLLALVLGWGYHTPLYRLLFQLPLMDKWRDPLKWLEVTDFAVITLSALGMQRLLATLESDSPAIRVVRRRIGWLMAIFLMLLGAGFIFSFLLTLVLAANLHASNYDNLSIANAMSTLHLSMGVALVIMALACFLLFTLWRPDFLRQRKLVNPWLQQGWERMMAPQHLPLTLALGFALLSVIQLGWVAAQFIQPTPLAYLIQSNSFLEALKNEGRAVRVSVEAQDPMLNTLLQNQFNADDISSIDISAASRIPDAFAAFRSAFADNQARYWLLAGVKNVAIAQQSLAQLRTNSSIATNIDGADGYVLQQTQTPELPSHALVRLRDYFPKGILIPSAEVLSTDQAMLQRLKDPEWNPRVTVLLSTPSPLATPISSGEISPNQVTLETYTPHEMDFQVNATQPAYLLINDQYDPDWQATLNDQPAPLLRADFLLRAVAVPAGTSQVKLYYRAHYRLGGLSLPAVAVNLFSDGAWLGAWLLAGVMLWPKKKGCDKTRVAEIAASRETP